jgi:hypothetical protein
VQDAKAHSHGDEFCGGQSDTGLGMRGPRSASWGNPTPTRILAAAEPTPRPCQPHAQRGIVARGSVHPPMASPKCRARKDAARTSVGEMRSSCMRSTNCLRPITPFPFWLAMAKIFLSSKTRSSVRFRPYCPLKSNSCSNTGCFISALVDRASAIFIFDMLGRAGVVGAGSRQVSPARAASVAAGAAAFVW